MTGKWRGIILRDPLRISRVMGLGLALIIVLLLLLPLDLPVGYGYRDFVMFLDGRHRLGGGQIPHRDFFAPFGPLGLYLLHWTLAIFPAAHPILAAQYSAALLALPVVYLVCSRLSSTTVCGLLWGFFIPVALLPVNFATLPEPFLNGGVAGFGVYNRQAGLLLFAFMTTLFWGRNTRAADVAAALLFAGLFFIKITAFASALPLMLWGVLAGRFRLKAIAATWLVCAVLLIGLQLGTSLVGAYLSDCLLMAKGSRGAGLARIRDIAMPSIACLTALGMIVVGRGWQDGVRRGWAEAILMVRGDTPGLVASFLIAVVIESQNSGSQAFIFLVPAVIFAFPALALEGDTWRWTSRWAAVGSIGFLVLIGGQLAERTVRLAAALGTHAAVPELAGTPIRVRAAPRDYKRAKDWLEFYRSQPDATRILTVGALKDSAGAAAVHRTEEHLVPMLNAAALAEAVKRFEAQSGQRFHHVATLDFVDLAPMLLGRPAVHGLPIVMDIDRIMSDRLRTKVLAQLEGVDAIFATRCGAFAWYGADYAELAKPVTGTRRAVELTPCWTAYLR